MRVMTQDEYLREKQAQVFSEAHTQARLSGFCCYRCDAQLLVGATVCPHCRHMFQWPCPAKEKVPHNPQGEMQTRILHQLYQDFRYAPAPTMPFQARPEPIHSLDPSAIPPAGLKRRWLVWAAISSIGIYVLLMVGYVMNLTGGPSDPSSHPSKAIPAISRQSTLRSTHSVPSSSKRVGE